jgi:hypothetical protein
VFREPLRRDPLVVGWVLVLLAAGFAVLSKHTTWSGHLEADRVFGFLKDFAEAFLWSFLLLLVLAWLRKKGWHGAARPRRTSKAPERRQPYPWTDRWLRDWREAEARTRQIPDTQEGGLPTTCRHGVPVHESMRIEQAPVLRALSLSHSIVRPGGRVSVTWCFAHCRAVVVDGRGGYPPCGEAPVRIDHTRRIEVVGQNRFGATPAATAAVVAMEVPHLPTVESPPPVSLRTDVAATVGAPTPITQRLDDFWATQDHLRPPLDPPPALVGVPPRLTGVPAELINSLRRARRPERER